MKKLTAIIASLAISLTALSANIPFINDENLPQNKEISKAVDTLISNVQFISPMGVSSKSPKPADVITNETNDLLKLLSSEKKPSYDTMLLKLFCQTELYNLNACSHADIDSTFKTMTKKFPKEYRTFWIYGNYKVSSVIEAENLSYFEKASELAGGLENTQPGFLSDYAYCCLMLQMPEKGISLLKIHSKKTGIPLEENALYKMLISFKNESKLNEMYSETDTWKASKIKNDAFIFSTILGFSAKIDPSLPLISVQLDKNMSLFSLRLNGFESNGIKIGTSLLAQAFAGHMTDGKIEYQTNQFINGYTLDKTYTRTINGTEFTIYECSSNLINNNPVQKGGKCYLAVATVPYTPDMESEIEKPITSQQGKHYSRINDDVNWFFFLPACKAIEKSAGKWFDSFLSTVTLR